MNREFVSYEQALELKKLGFNEECLSSWNLYSNDFNYNSYPSSFESEDIIQLPLYQQAFRWFRKKHGLHHEIKKEKGINNSTNIFFVPITQSGLKKKLTHTPQHTCEEAEIACLNKLIEILKK